MVDGSGVSMTSTASRPNVLLPVAPTANVNDTALTLAAVNVPLTLLSV